METTQRPLMPDFGSYWHSCFRDLKTKTKKQWTPPDCKSLFDLCPGKLNTIILCIGLLVLAPSESDAFDLVNYMELGQISLKSRQEKYFIFYHVQIN